MPDVTTTLLAMYQQIIGGSTAREQSALEAEAARRVILSGLSITGAGSVNLPTLVTVGTLVVNGPVNITGVVTVASLTVTGNASVGGTLTAGFLTVTGSATIGADCGITGILTVNGLGNHAFSAAGGGGNVLQVRNTAAGTGNLAAVQLGNNLTAFHTTLQATASNFTPTGFNFADGATLVCSGAGGLTVAASGASAVLRFFSGNAVTERARFLSTGEFVINGTGTFGLSKLAVLADATAASGIAVQNLSVSTPALPFLMCVNSSGATQGQVVGVTSTSVAFNTTSDARLKDDLGRADDLTALRGVVVHDFTWTGDGNHDRGVFAQEAAAVFPRAITTGTDERTPTGTLARPWMTDYSKFVPDLIVGWQQHEAALTRVLAILAAGTGQASAGDSDAAGTGAHS
jgi:hypothetical protein